MTVINLFLFLVQYDMDLLMVLCMLQNVACAVLLTIRYSQTSGRLRPGVISGGVVLVPVLLFSLLEVISFGKNTVFETVQSPEGTYRAVVVESDEGALGGDAYVNIYKKGPDTPLIRLVPLTEQIWIGEWLDYENLEIYWESDNCLIINGEEFEFQ